MQRTVLSRIVSNETDTRYYVPQQIWTEASAKNDNLIHSTANNLIHSTANMDFIYDPDMTLLWEYARVTISFFKSTMYILSKLGDKDSFYMYCRVVNGRPGGHGQLLFWLSLVAGDGQSRILVDFMTCSC